MFQDNIQITLPDEFLNAEERCGHMVTSEMKKVWAVELDLLYVFQQFCSEHNLKWFMAYGSLIGAVRHKGFIPWDNDIDVMMPRDDFDKFCELAPKHFKHPYFLQTPITEHGNYYKSYAKLCNSETTGCSELEWRQGINGGIFIDIFVLDNIPSSCFLIKLFQFRINYITHYTRFLSPYPRKYKGLSFVKHAFWFFSWKLFGSFKGDFIFSTVNNYCRRNNRYNGKYCSFVASGIKQKEIWEKDWWGMSEMVSFEFLSVPVPKNYSPILKSQYGDYMVLPSIEERDTHSYLSISADIPYFRYFK